jgi:3'(2'), 5'-bisphosphate nucleotidase
MSAQDPLEPVLDAMVVAARAASRVCRRVQADVLRAARAQKQDRSPVTVADLAGQALISSRLGRLFPDVPLVAEEDSSVLDDPALRSAVLERVREEWTGASEVAVLAAIDRGGGQGGVNGRFFVLDPIDGTKGFLRGDQYAVALALVEDGRVVAGLLSCPNLPAGGNGGHGVIFSAIAGRGTRCLPLDAHPQDAPAVRLSMVPGDVSVCACRVSGISDPREMRLCESVVAAHSAHGRSAQIARHLGVKAEPVRVDSQAKYALLARGDAEVYLRIPRDENRKEKIWDHAAGALVVEEAGGRVTDLDGRELDFGQGPTLAANRGILASNGAVHEAVLEALRAI